MSLGIRFSTEIFTSIFCLYKVSESVVELIMIIFNHNLREYDSHFFQTQTTRCMKNMKPCSQSTISLLFSLFSSQRIYQFYMHKKFRTITLIKKQDILQSSFNHGSSIAFGTINFLANFHVKYRFPFFFAFHGFL